MRSRGQEISGAEVVFRSDMTVELIKHAACDADVICAARVSTTGEQSLAEIDAEPDRSAGLISYLMRDRHAPSSTRR
jgi:thymidylate synthase (FAD)